MNIVKPAYAGTLESSDVRVSVNPGGAIEIEVESIVAAQFKDAIIQTVREVLDEFKVTGAFVALKDQGALDCTIRTRVETALRRAAGGAS